MANSHESDVGGVGVQVEPLSREMLKRKLSEPAWPPESMIG